MTCRDCGEKIEGGKGDYWHVLADGIRLMRYCGHLAYPTGEDMSENNLGPGDPIRPLLDAAVSMHELFISFVEAGFTEQQALFLVAQSLRPTPNQ